MADNNDVAPKFRSFFMAGFECTYALVDPQRKVRFDLLAASKHDVLCREDYRMIGQYGMKTVREGLAWHQIDKGGGRYDFSRFEPMMRIGQEEGVEQIWDLNHFDYPEYLDPYAPGFITSFAEYARQCVRLIRKYSTGTIYIVPFNEISFYTYISATEGHWAPFRSQAKPGVNFKHQLVKGTFAAMDAIRQEDNDVRFVQVDPIMVRYPADPTDTEAQHMADDFNQVGRFEAWDMLCGQKNPELGGDPKYLDILGINYYAVNQEWIIKRPHDTGYYNIMIPPEDPAHTPVDEILQNIYQRYQRPMFIAETGSHGEFRYSWWKKVLAEINRAMDKGLPIHGVCAYPIIDKPTKIPFLWPQSGLWDFYQLGGEYERRPHYPALDIIEPYVKKWAKS